MSNNQKVFFLGENFLVSHFLNFKKNENESIFYKFISQKWAFFFFFVSVFCQDARHVRFNISNLKCEIKFMYLIGIIIHSNFVKQITKI